MTDPEWGGYHWMGWALKWKGKLSASLHVIVALCFLTGCDMTNLLPVILHHDQLQPGAVS